MDEIDKSTKEPEQAEEQLEAAGAERRLSVLNNGLVVETDSAPEVERR